MIPTNRELEAAGHNTQELVDALLSDEWVNMRTPAAWIVRWRGRVKVINGTAVFSTRARAEQEVKTWMRSMLRNVVHPWTPFRASVPDPGARLPSRWGYTKKFRVFSDSFVDHLVFEGIVQYQEIDPPLNADTALR